MRDLGANRSIEQVQTGMPARPHVQSVATGGTEARSFGAALADEIKDAPAESVPQVPATPADSRIETAAIPQELADATAPARNPGTPAMAEQSLPPKRTTPRSSQKDAGIVEIAMAIGVSAADSGPPAQPAVALPSAAPVPAEAHSSSKALLQATEPAGIVSTEPPDTGTNETGPTRIRLATSASSPSAPLPKTDLSDAAATGEASQGTSPPPDRPQPPDLPGNAGSTSNVLGQTASPASSAAAPAASAREESRTVLAKQPSLPPALEGTPATCSSPPVTPPPGTTTSAASPGSAASLGTATSPTGALPDQTNQVARGIIRLVDTPGGSRLTIQLAPEHLGNVQVEIDRTVGGATTIVLRADRPDTLSLLQQDHAQLASALDRGGVPADGRSISFHAEPQATQHLAGTTEMAPPSSPAGGTHSAGMDGQPNGHPNRQPAGFTDFGSQPGQHQGRRQPNTLALPLSTDGQNAMAADDIIPGRIPAKHFGWNTHVNITA